MITGDGVGEWLGTYARCSQGEDLGQIHAIYLHDETEKPEFAAVRVADGRTWLVPLASAIAQDDVVHLAYARDEVEAVPVVAAGDRLSEDDLTRLYLHYGLGRRATAAGEHGVHARRWDWERGDFVGGLEESREVQPGQRAGRQSAQVKAGGFTADVGDVSHRTVEELQQLAAQRDIQGRAQMHKRDLLTTLYQDCTLDELRDIAAHRGIHGRSKMSKTDLNTVLLQDSDVAASGTDSEQRSQQRGIAAGGPYEKRSLTELRQLAAERGIQGRSQMNKAALVTALYETSGAVTSGAGQDERTADGLQELAADRGTGGPGQTTDADLVTAGADVEDAELTGDRKGDLAAGGAGYEELVQDQTSGAGDEGTGLAGRAVGLAGRRGSRRGAPTEREGGVAASATGREDGVQDRTSGVAASAGLAGYRGRGLASEHRQSPGKRACRTARR